MKFEHLPLGTYTVTESGAEQTGFFLEVEGYKEIVVSGTDLQITIVNKYKTGHELPETGGFGTELYYTSGGMIMIFASLFLGYIIKRRREDQREE